MYYAISFFAISFVLYKLDYGELDVKLKHIGFRRILQWFRRTSPQQNLMMENIFGELHQNIFKLTFMQ